MPAKGHEHAIWSLPLRSWDTPCLFCARETYTQAVFSALVFCWKILHQCRVKIPLHYSKPSVVWLIANSPHINIYMLWNLDSYYSLSKLFWFSDQANSLRRWRSPLHISPIQGTESTNNVQLAFPGPRWAITLKFSEFISQWASYSTLNLGHRKTMFAVVLIPASSDLHDTPSVALIPS
jgi:hypothetical protein